MRKSLVDIARPLGFAVHEHIIVGRGGPCEFPQP
jgi:hypothetical protein